MDFTALIISVRSKVVGCMNRVDASRVDLEVISQQLTTAIK